MRAHIQGHQEVPGQRLQAGHPWDVISWCWFVGNCPGRCLQETDVQGLSLWGDGSHGSGRKVACTFQSSSQSTPLGLTDLFLGTARGWFTAVGKAQAEVNGLSNHLPSGRISEIRHIFGALIQWGFECGQGLASALGEAVGKP